VPGLPLRLPLLFQVERWCRTLPSVRRVATALHAVITVRRLIVRRLLLSGEFLLTSTRLLRTIVSWHLRPCAVLSKAFRRLWRGGLPAFSRVRTNTAAFIVARFVLTMALHVTEAMADGPVAVEFVHSVVK